MERKHFEAHRSMAKFIPFLRCKTCNINNWTHMTAQQHNYSI